MRRLVTALAACALVAPVLAKTVLTPGPRPTTIVPGREPFTFAHPPTLRTAFSRDEPFLEGELAYGYPGRLVTPIQRGSDVVAPAGSPAFGVPVQVRNAPRLNFWVAVGFGDPDRLADYNPPELAWCAATRTPGKPRIGAVCLFNEGLGFAGYDSLMGTMGYILDQDPHGGGEIGPGTVDFAAPIRVRYYVQNLGKIARIKGQVWVGDTMVNQWGYQFGDIGRGAQPVERRFGVGGGVIGISPDPAAKDRYVLRVIEPLRPDGRAPLTEVRNDSRARPAQP